MPQLKTNEEVKWEEKGAGKNFECLCFLLRGNVIPTKSLDITCKNETSKNQKSGISSHGNNTKWLGNDIEGMGATMLGGALAKNTGLTSLDLDSDENSNYCMMTNDKRKECCLNSDYNWAVWR